MEPLPDNDTTGTASASSLPPFLFAMETSFLFGRFTFFMGLLSFLSKCTGSVESGDKRSFISSLDARPERDVACSSDTVIDCWRCTTVIFD